MNEDISSTSNFSNMPLPQNQNANYSNIEQNQNHFYHSNSNVYSYSNEPLTPRSGSMSYQGSNINQLPTPIANGSMENFSSDNNYNYNAYESNFPTYGNELNEGHQSMNLSPITRYDYDYYRQNSIPPLNSLSSSNSVQFPSFNVDSIDDVGDNITDEERASFGKVSDELSNLDVD